MTWCDMEWFAKEDARCHVLVRDDLKRDVKVRNVVYGDSTD